MEETTYLVVDGENIDATLGLSVLDRRPNPGERPRWDRILEGAHNQWGQRAKGLFFLNGSSGSLPMGFVQALTAMDYALVLLHAFPEHWWSWRDVIPPLPRVHGPAFPGGSRRQASSAPQP